MDAMNALFLLAGLLLFISVLASTISARLGLPLLLLFLVVGMVAGEDGPGGIQFDDFGTANLIGQLALAVILLDGGLRTRTETFRVALRPAGVLATWGVIATSGLLGAFATWWLDVDWRLGFLLAAIVGSTDAAAVFALLRNSGVRLSERVRSTLEIESGANDPMAILLVAVFVDMLLHPAQASLGGFLWMLTKQMGLGIGLGLAGGWILSRLLVRLTLAEGLYALLILSGGILIFAAINLIGGSGLLAIYVAGIVVGQRRNHATEHVLRVMDGLAWLAQAGMFVVLGLLVTPSHVLAHAPEALAMALFLMLVARPLAVAGGLLPFRYAWKEIAFVSWVGLRGAVPVVLAIVPVVMGVPDSKLLFDVAFAVVLLSLLVQGATIPTAARWLDVELPPKDEPTEWREVWVGREAVLNLLACRVAAGSDAEGRHPDELAAGVGGDARALAVIRAGRLCRLEPGLRLAIDDTAWFVAPASAADALAGACGGSAQNLGRNAAFFGEFSVDPGVAAGDLAAAYGFELEDGEAGLTVSALLLHRIGRPAVLGDRVRIGAVTLVVREMQADGEVSLVGVKCPWPGLPDAA